MLEKTTEKAPNSLFRADLPISWVVASQLVDYADAVARMERQAEAIAAGEAAEQVWLLEHPPLYTAGTSAVAADLLTPDRFPVYRSGRGGQYTYHGPGQRIAYVMLDLGKRGRDVRLYVHGLEAWLIDALAHLDVSGETRPDRVGVWVRRPDRMAGAEDKIAAIGVRVRRWVTFHGVALNVSPELEHFSGIVPCGVKAHGVTSLAELRRETDMAAVDAVLRSTFEKRFGPTCSA